MHRKASHRLSAHAQLPQSITARQSTHARRQVRAHLLQVSPFFVAVTDAAVARRAASPRHRTAPSLPTPCAALLPSEGGARHPGEPAPKLLAGPRAAATGAPRRAAVRCLPATARARALRAGSRWWPQQLQLMLLAAGLGHKHRRPHGDPGARQQRPQACHAARLSQRAHRVHRRVICVLTPLSPFPPMQRCALGVCARGRTHHHGAQVARRRGRHPLR